MAGQRPAAAVARIGVEKSLPAATTDAATSSVPASVPRAWVRAACRLVAVAAGVAPIVNWPAAGVAEAVAVSVRSRLVPSGRVKVNLTVSPSTGVATVRSTDMAGGVPLGGLTVAPLMFVVVPTSLKPNGDTASSASDTEVAVGAPTTSRPRPLVPRSACLRSSIICLSPALRPSPSRMWSTVSTGA